MVVKIVYNIMILWNRNNLITILLDKYSVKHATHQTYDLTQIQEKKCYQVLRYDTRLFPHSETSAIYIKPL